MASNLAPDVNPDSRSWRTTGGGPAWGLRFLDQAFRRLPLRGAYALVIGLAPIYLMHFNIPRESLKKAAARLGYPRPFWGALAIYAQYILLLVDRWYIRRGQLTPQLEFLGGEHGRAAFGRLLEDERPLVLLGSHLGALQEVVPALAGLGRVVRPVAVHDAGAQRLLAEVGDPSEGIARQGDTIVADGTVKSGLAMLGAMRRGEILAFKADRTLPGRDGALVAQVLGEPVPLPKGPAELARLGKARAVAVNAVRVGPGRFLLLAEDLGPTGDVQATVDAYAESLSRHAAAYPNQWFNFFPYWPADEAALTSLPETVPPGLRAALRGARGAVLAGAIVALGWPALGHDPVQAVLAALGSAAVCSAAVGVIGAFGLGAAVDRDGRANAAAWPVALAAPALTVLVATAALGGPGGGPGLRAIATVAAIAGIAYGAARR